jgi:hypothetical protein
LESRRKKEEEEDEEKTREKAKEADAETTEMNKPFAVANVLPPIDE